MIAKVLASAFNIRLIQYQGSAQRLIRADFGTLKVDATVLGANIKFELKMALLSALGIGGRRRLLSKVTKDLAKDVVETQPSNGQMNPGTELQDLQNAVQNKDKWGGGRRRRHWHHRHRPHIHHRHRPHLVRPSFSACICAFMRMLSAG